MQGILLIFIACFLWALDSVFRTPLVQSGISALTIVFTEHLFLGIVSISLLISKGFKLGEVTLKEVGLFFLVGAVGSTLATIAFTRAFLFINPSIVILLQQWQPFVAMILAKLLLKESLTKNFLIGACICLIGATLVGHPHWEYFYDLVFNRPQNILKDGAHFGYVLALFAAFSWGMNTVFGKMLIKMGRSEVEIMAGRFLFGLIALLPFIQSEFIFVKLNALSTIKIITMALISGLIGMYFYYKGLKKVDAKVATLAELFFPFCAILVNWHILNQPLTSFQILGAVILVVSSTILQWKHV